MQLKSDEEKSEGAYKDHTASSVVKPLKETSFSVHFVKVGFKKTAPILKERKVNKRKYFFYWK